MANHQDDEVERFDPSAEPIPEFSVAESTRWANLGRERNVKSIGLLFYSFAFLWLVFLLIMVGETPRMYQLMIEHAQSKSLRSQFYSGIGLMSFCVVALGSNAILGFGLRRFQPWARKAALRMTTLGTVFAGEMCYLDGWKNYLLMGCAGFVVVMDFVLAFYFYDNETANLFTLDYDKMQQATPQVHCSTTWLFRFLLVFIIVPIVFLFLRDALSVADNFFVSWLSN